MQICKVKAKQIIYHTEIAMHRLHQDLQIL